MTWHTAFTAVTLGAAVLTVGCGGSDNKVEIPKDLNKPLPPPPVGSGGEGKVSKKAAAPSNPNATAE